MTTRLCFPALGGAVLALNALGASIDTAKIEQITGLKGAWNADEGVFKVSSPRHDVGVKVDEWRMPPFMGLTSWAGFLAGKKAEAMVMGDFVLFEDEVNPVMSAASFDDATPGAPPPGWTATQPAAAARNGSPSQTTPHPAGRMCSNGPAPRA
jgi:hypothetical protein